MSDLIIKQANRKFSYTQIIAWVMFCLKDN